MIFADRIPCVVMFVMLLFIEYMTETFPYNGIQAS